MGPGPRAPSPFAPSPHARRPGPLACSHLPIPHAYAPPTNHCARALPSRMPAARAPRTVGPARALALTYPACPHTLALPRHTSRGRPGPFASRACSRTSARPARRARACPSCFSRTYTVPYPPLAPLPDVRVTPPLVLQPQQPAAAVPCGRLDYCTSPSKAAAAVISLSPPSPSKKELTGPRRSRWVN